MSDVPKSKVYDILPYSIWRHIKSNSLYIVLGVGLCSTNDERQHKEESVIYYSVEHEGLRYRKLEEFIDGRFELYSLKNGGK